MAPNQQQIFIGIVVNPKNGKPAFVQRKPAWSRTARVFASELESETGGRGGRPATNYIPIGEGYLDECGSSYSRFARAVGYPRVHTPGGLSGASQGKGWGVTLYVGLAMLATGEARKIYTLPGLCGSGEGIHSIQNDRSEAAESWWARARNRGLVTEEEIEGDADTSYEEETDSIEWRSLSSAMRSTIEDALSGRFDFSRIDDASFDIVREVPVEDDEGSATCDVLTFDACWEHNLIALFDPREGSWEEWGKLSPMQSDAGEYDKDVIVALNLVDEDEDIARWFVDLAKQSGATAAEIEGMKIRAEYRADPSPATAAVVMEATGEPSEKLAKRNVKVLMEAAGMARSAGDDVVAARLEEIVAAGGVRDNHLLDQLMTKNPPRDHRRRRQPRRMVRNPAGNERAIERALHQVEEKRERLGWTDLGDL